MWVKICGIRDVNTAGEVARLGPDAIGLNFYEATPRSVLIKTAREIVRTLPEGVEPVGLFVNHTVEQIQETCRHCQVRTLQLHGDEPPELLAELREDLAGAKLVRAFRVGEEGFADLGEYLESCRRLGVSLDACLVDARVEGAYGGTGTTVSWELLAREYQRDAWPRLILAGGLEPDNVAEAIHAVRPWGVDVASGVESAPGKKDLERVKRFIENARNANHG